MHGGLYPELASGSPDETKGRKKKDIDLADFAGADDPPPLRDSKDQNQKTNKILNT